MGSYTLQEDDVVVLIGQGDVHAIVLKERPVAGMDLFIAGQAGLERGRYRVRKVENRKAPGGGTFPAVDITRTGDLPAGERGLTVFFTSI